MRYFFESGVFPELSFVELVSVFHSFNISPDCIRRTDEKILLVESNALTINELHKIFLRLGGFVRFGIVIDDLDTFLTPYTKQEKITFAISSLNSKNVTLKEIQSLSNDIKRNFKKIGISSRFILPKRNVLNAAQITKNNILEEGFELCIFDIKRERYFGNTIAVQDINSFVKRDLDKPFSDYDMGVLPQKLARIMCNLTGLKEGIIWDPFCGSGTILMEASELGFDVLGSDIDIRSIEGSEQNLRWLLGEDTKYNVFYLDIHNVEKKAIRHLKLTGINAVVCEPFMGPPQRRVISVSKAEELLNNVKKIYISLFKVLDQISTSNFKVVLILPEYKTTNGWISLRIKDIVGKKWDILNRQLGEKDLKWKRINSIITRSIFVLSKK